MSPVNIITDLVRDMSSLIYIDIILLKQIKLSVTVYRLTLLIENL